LWGHLEPGEWLDEANQDDEDEWFFEDDYYDYEDECQRWDEVVIEDYRESLRQKCTDDVTQLWYI